jgi:hypothetical protein
MWQLPVLSALTLVWGGASSAQAQLEKISKKLRDDVSDAVELQRAFTKDCDRFQMATGLVTDAQFSSFLLDDTSKMLEMYLEISTPKDRSAVRTLLKGHIVSVVAQLEINVKEISEGMGYQTTAGLVAQASRTRDDIRAALEILSALRNQL